MRTWLTSLLVAMFVFTGAAAAQGPIKVEIEVTPDGFRLLRGGEPYFIKGGGGQSHLDVLAASGGNSFRTWGAEDGKRLLDEAHRLGLTVTLGIWIGHERHGFDYSDPKQVNDQRAMVEAVVREFKDHPALLMWGLGNEVALLGEPRKLFPEVERLAKIIKSIDQHHPIMCVISGSSTKKLTAMMELCPSVDIIGVNQYGDAADVPEALDRADYSGPYVLTEYGPRGWWESPKTPWGAQIEPTSAEKAEQYAHSHEMAVLRRPEQCFGSYVFLWGQKQEATATWFGMFLEDGSKTPVVDVMHRFWTGEEPPNRAPVVSGIVCPAAHNELEPGQPFAASVEVTDADDDKLRAEWVIMAESTDRRMGGDAESKPPAFPDLTVSKALEGARFKAPSEPGAYRLYVTVYDQMGSAGVANLPFYVRDGND